MRVCTNVCMYVMSVCMIWYVCVDVCNVCMLCMYVEFVHVCDVYGMRVC